MKKVILFFIAIIIIPVLTAQNTQVKKDPVGKWKFEAPYAPEGYTSGIIEVGLAEMKYSTSMMFSDIEYKFIGEKVKFENDSLFFLIYIEGQDITVSLKMENGTKMSGKAVYSEGEVPLTLSKTVSEGK